MRVPELELELEFEFNAIAELELELLNSTAPLPTHQADEPPSTRAPRERSRLVRTGSEGFPRRTTGCVRRQLHAFLSSSKKRAYRPRGKVLLGQFGHAGFISDVEIPRFGYFPGAERAQRRARARNRAKRVRGGMGVNSPSMKTHRATQGLGWCIETRVWIPAFVLWTRR